MRSGSLRHLVELQRLTAESPDQTPSGEPSEDWQTFATIYASIEPLSGRELFVALEHHPEATVRITIRYRNDVTAKERVVYATKIYNVLAPLNTEERRRELKLLCSEGLNEG